MSVTEYERNQLFTWFEEHMGKERASTMMSLLPPVGWADVATKRDLDLVAERLDTKIDRVAERLDTKIDRVAERLDGTIDAVGERLDARIDTLDVKLSGRMDALSGRTNALSGRIDGIEGRMATKADLHELHVDMQRTFVTWMFASQAAVIAAMGVLLAIFR